MTAPESARAHKQSAVSDHTIPAHAHASEAALHAEDQGYHKGLKPRQIQMIAIGGAIGTGLFMGAGGRLATAGPALMISLRGLRVLRLPDPARAGRTRDAPAVVRIVRLLRPRVLRREGRVRRRAGCTGSNWAMTAIVDVTAVALYMNFFKKYWAAIAAVPQWVFALAALVVVLGLNLVSVKVFGELEFWFALIKVVALVAFLVVGIYFVIFGTPVDGHEVGLQPDRRQRRLAPQRAAARRRGDAGRRVRLRLDRAGRHRRRRDARTRRRSCRRPSTR